MGTSIVRTEYRITGLIVPGQTYVPVQLVVFAGVFIVEFNSVVIVMGEMMKKMMKHKHCGKRNLL